MRCRLMFDLVKRKKKNIKQKDLIFKKFCFDIITLVLDFNGEIGWKY